jgi:hypothetical protein
MSELTLTVIKLGFLALLWLFVLSAFSVVRSDLFGTRSTRSEWVRDDRAPPRAVRAASRAWRGSSKGPTPGCRRR